MTKGVLGLTFLVWLLTSTVCGLQYSASATPYSQFRKGITYGTGWYDRYEQPESDQALRALAETGANWVSLIVVWFQKDLTDSAFAPDANHTATDRSVIHAISTIHGLGMKVMLRPLVDLLCLWDASPPSCSGQGISRTKIAPKNAKAWFDSYRTFIIHYAQLAEAQGVEMLCVGSELASMTTSAYTQNWLEIINEVRQVFSQELTYAVTQLSWNSRATPSGNTFEEIGFYDAVDYIGFDPYPHLTDKKDPTVSELKEAWQRVVAEIETRQKATGKKMIFTEIGFRDVNGTNIGPRFGSTSEQDEQEQADCYQATFETIWDKPWLEGIFWFWWRSRPMPQDWDPWGKLAEKVVRTWYSKPYVPQGTPAEAVSALVAIQEAENAIAKAMREERTRGLDQARGLLSQAVEAYNRGDFAGSQAFASNGLKAADRAVKQKEYDEAAAVVDEARKRLNSLRSAALQSVDAIQLRQQAEAEFVSALMALNSNQFDLAKARANNVTSLAERVFTIERDHQTQQTVMRQRNELIVIASTIAGISLALTVVAVLRGRKKKKAMT